MERAVFCCTVPMSLTWIDDVLATGPEFTRASATLKEARSAVWLDGLAGTARLATVAYLTRCEGRLLLLVVASPQQAEQALLDLQALGFPAEAVGLYPDAGPALDDFLPETRIAASSVAPERRALARQRLTVLERLAAGGLQVIVAPITAVVRGTIGPIKDHQLRLAVGDILEPQDLAEKLVEFGYERAELVEEPGQFALRGGLIDVFPATRPRPVRLDFFGDEIDSLREFDPQTQRSLAEPESVTLLPAHETPAAAASGQSLTTLIEHLPATALVAIDEPNHLAARLEESVERDQRRRQLATAEAGASASPEAPCISLDELRERLEPFSLLILTLLAQSQTWLRGRATAALRIAINSGVVESFSGDIPELANRMKSWMGGRQIIAVASDQPHRVTELLVEQEVPVEDVSASKPIANGEGHRDDSGGPVVRVHQGHLSTGFRLPGLRFTLLTDAEIFPQARQRPRTRPVGPDFQQGRPILSLMELSEGDHVVHEVHGIGRYLGLVIRQSQGIEREFIQIEYRGADRLFVPSEQLDRVQKFIGSGDEGGPTLHRLGGAEWKRTKSRVRAKVREMAQDLLNLYARREAAEGYPFGPDTVWQAELEASFPYQETGDQLRAISDVRKDMESTRVMDRLICGDVGYGKTEVAIRAAFKAVNDSRQVAVLVPTTVLAQQHFNTFSERLAPFPVRVELLSRFRTTHQQKQIVADLNAGLVDIVIGTHRLLSKDVKFHELGLIITDEEQRFGVAHKERLKQLKTTADALTLTATPIPRTMHMSLTGIRDMSVIEEPPEGRLAVRTYCMEADDHIIREAVLRELDRGGQVYFVHNRVQDIHRHARRLQELAPQARIRIGHGQMTSRQLEEVMLDFYEGRFDVLVCTTIIESGLDIANVNTIIVNEADRFGLSQLHQLRGRVGRGSRQAYCYLTYKPYKQLSETAEKRLATLREFTALGAGFKIAMRDMEIRGAGNLLGAEQHGNIAAVGFELYCQMIEEEVKSLRGEPTEKALLPTVTLPIPCLIPERYVPTSGLRISCYRKIAGCQMESDVDAVQEELEDRFGDPPKMVWNLLAIMRLRMRCLAAGIARIEGASDKTTLWMARKLDRRAVGAIHREFRRARIQPDRIVLYHEGNPLRPVEDLVDALREFGGKRAAAAVQQQLQAVEHLDALATSKSL